MTRLSVNINKIATLRNARGGNIPNVAEASRNCERFGAQGVTVHPRPDERHIRYQDVREIRPTITTEFNMEGYPSGPFLELVKEVRPHQVTFVPDAPGTLTSNQGWDAASNKDFLKKVIRHMQSYGIRTSLFVETDTENIKHAGETGTDRVELYTEPYARDYPNNREQAIEPFIKAAEAVGQTGMGLNAGHDLNLDNLSYFSQHMPGLLEVSIGHALIADALYYGLENTIQLYLRQLK
ncbi:MAG: pyridoxine 5'-phosphate synthase [Bacteroidales bacterium]|nr:pyridoxine 5'-phosphate synthase [Bacteroidales bacterium]